MKTCNNCNVLIDPKRYGIKFCSRSCSATFNNKGKVRNGLQRTDEEKRSRKQLKICRDNEKAKQKRLTAPVLCKMCNVSISRTKKYCNTCHPSILTYRSRCEFKFNVFDFPTEFNLELVKQYGWYSPTRNKHKVLVPNLNGVSRDHMYSVSQGFKNKRDPTKLSHPANCNLMLHVENNLKNEDCDLTWEQLLDRIEQWNNKYVPMAE